MPAEPHDRATIIRSPLLTALLGPRGRLCGRVEVKEITFEPGQKTGLHLHKIPVVGYSRPANSCSRSKASRQSV